uniref:Uncharacterized protein n=1 Tax=Anguilla anguilla TaxID=7936 RepID=A0A0E9R9M9_ANGAN
MPTEVRPM